MPSLQQNSLTQNILAHTRTAIGDQWHSLSPADRAAIERAAQIAADAAALALSGQPVPDQLLRHLDAHLANITSIAASLARDALLKSAANILATAATALLRLPV
jgi:hypothetical protein